MLGAFQVPSGQRQAGVRVGSSMCGRPGICLEVRVRVHVLVRGCCHLCMGVVRGAGVPDARGLNEEAWTGQPFSRRAGGKPLLSAVGESGAKG